MPRLVVMMTAKNAATTIGLAIRSTLVAMPADSGLLVCDDGSTDDTQQIVEAFPDRRIRVFRNESSVGVGAAHIALMDRTDSLYVANVDADDISLPWRFSAPIRELGRGSDLVFGSALRFGGRRFRSSLPIHLDHRSSNIALTLYNPFYHSSMTARRDALALAGGYSSIPRSEDYDLWLRAASSGARLLKLAMPLIGYRESVGQLSQSSRFQERSRDQTQLRRSYLSHLAHVAGLSGAGEAAQLTSEERHEMLQHLISTLGRPTRDLLAKRAAVAPAPLYSLD